MERKKAFAFAAVIIPLLVAVPVNKLFPWSIIVERSMELMGILLFSVVGIFLSRFSFFQNIVNKIPRLQMTEDELTYFFTAAAILILAIFSSFVAEIFLFVGIVVGLMAWFEFVKPGFISREWPYILAFLFFVVSNVYLAIFYQFQWLHLLNSFLGFLIASRLKSNIVKAISSTPFRGLVFME